MRVSLIVQYERLLLSVAPLRSRERSSISQETAVVKEEVGGGGGGLSCPILNERKVAELRGEEAGSVNGWG